MLYLHLVQESVNSQITKQHFKELVGKLIKCHSLQIKLLGTQTYFVFIKRSSVIKESQTMQCVIKNQS